MTGIECSEKNEACGRTMKRYSLHHDPTVSATLLAFVLCAFAWAMYGTYMAVLGILVLWVLLMLGCWIGCVCPFWLTFILWCAADVASMWSVQEVFHLSVWSPLMLAAYTLAQPFGWLTLYVRWQCEYGP